MTKEKSQKYHLMKGIDRIPQELLPAVYQIWRNTLESEGVGFIEGKREIPDETVVVNLSKR